MGAGGKLFKIIVKITLVKKHITHLGTRICWVCLTFPIIINIFCLIKNFEIDLAVDQKLIDAEPIIEKMILIFQRRNKCTALFTINFSKRSGTRKRIILDILFKAV